MKVGNVVDEAEMRPVCEEPLIVPSNVTRPRRMAQKLCCPLASAACSLLLVSSMLVASQALADENQSSDINYRLGQGFRVADTGISLGGYATAGYDNLRDSTARAGLDNLSLFVWWQGEGRWKFFSEFDYETEPPNRSLDPDAQDHYLALERFYFDYALTDTATIRAGKFLTPIGRWNLIHATPLVWTSSRPLITTQIFPTNVTGLMVNGTLDAVHTGVEYSLYASRGNELRPNPAQDPFDEVIGAHLAFPLTSDAQLGFSYASFAQKHDTGEKKQLAGMDFFWTRNRYELSAEGDYRFSDNGSSWDEKGAFVQVVAPLSEKLYAVGRYETYRKAQEPMATQLLVTGLNYRITPAIVLKAEWISGKHNSVGAPEGFMSSLSILF